MSGVAAPASVPPTVDDGHDGGARVVDHDQTPPACVEQPLQQGHVDTSPGALIGSHAGLRHARPPGEVPLAEVSCMPRRAQNAGNLEATGWAWVCWHKTSLAT